MYSRPLPLHYSPFPSSSSFSSSITTTQEHKNTNTYTDVNKIIFVFHVMLKRCLTVSPERTHICTYTHLYIHTHLYTHLAHICHPIPSLIVFSPSFPDFPPFLFLLFSSLVFLLIYLFRFHYCLSLFILFFNLLFSHLPFSLLSYPIFFFHLFSHSCFFFSFHVCCKRYVIFALRFLFEVPGFNTNFFLSSTGESVEITLTVYGPGKQHPTPCP